MNTAVTMKRIAEISPRFKARIIGVFYLITILSGIFAEGFVSGRLVVEGDAAATATNILTDRSLFQLGLAAYLIEMACQVAMTGRETICTRPTNEGESEPLDRTRPLNPTGEPVGLIREREPF
jgi:Domain of unknown function (DUF4386)